MQVNSCLPDRNCIPANVFATSSCSMDHIVLSSSALIDRMSSSALSSSSVAIWMSLRSRRRYRSSDINAFRSAQYCSYIPMSSDIPDEQEIGACPEESED